MIILVVVVVDLVVNTFAGFIVVVFIVVDFVVGIDVFLFGFSVVVVGRGGALAGSGHWTLGINLNIQIHSHVLQTLTCTQLTQLVILL